MAKLRHRQPRLFIRPDREVSGLIPGPYRYIHLDTACAMYKATTTGHILDGYIVWNAHNTVFGWKSGYGFQFNAK